MDFPGNVRNGAAAAFMQSCRATCSVHNDIAHMNTQVFKDVILKLGKMSSRYAADWLVLTHPIGIADYGNAIALITRRPWKRSDQIRLARHYLGKLPFASARVYEAFLSFMSISLFLDFIK